MITKTKVVNLDGEKPTMKQIFLRSICRFIPFEPFSFFRSSGLGWHDTIPDTLVIKEE